VTFLAAIPWAGVAAAVAVLALCIGGYLVYLERRRARGQTRMVAMVRKRRELTQRLGELAGDSASQLAQLEARRQGDATTSLAVLEAAISRAERRRAGEP